nr:F390 synthetase-related protein [Heyndrickxia oleronia]
MLWLRTLSILLAYVKTKYFLKYRTREQLEKYQMKRLAKHLHYVCKYSTFYQERLKKIPPTITMDVLTTFPTIDKEIMMDHFDDLNTMGIGREEAFRVALEAEESRDFEPMINDVTIGLSSGTSGNRGLFIVSEKERNAWAGTVLAKLLPQSIRSPEVIAFFLRANSNLYQSVSEGRIQFHFFDLLEEIKTHIQRLKQFNPTILVAPPSMMRMIAEYVDQGEIVLQPKKIITVAEVLDPIDKHYIEKVFKQIIHQVYQCTEGFLAATCKYGTLHLNEDIVVIEKEWIDEKKKKFSPIITDFERKAQPIIRYRLNDILTIKEDPCLCGSPHLAIEQIEGRCDDIFYFNTNDGGSLPIFPDFVRRWIITSAPEVREYRVIQYQNSKLEIQMEPLTELMKEQVKNRIQSFLKEKNSVIPTIRFSKYQPNEKGRKLKRVERHGAF